MSEGDQPVRVLLADDAAMLRGLMRAKLTDTAGYEVVAEAGNGQEALEAARCTRPDVVVLDLSMPVMDGLTALPLLRQELPDAVIIVFTAFEGDLNRGSNSGQIIQTVLGRGADEYLEKGEVSLKGLLTRIGQLRAARRSSEAAKS